MIEIIAQEAKTMSPAGWVFMTIFWLLVILLVVFCFYKIFTKKK